MLESSYLAEGDTNFVRGIVKTPRGYAIYTKRAKLWVSMEDAIYLLDDFAEMCEEVSLIRYQMENHNG
jgi:hypothetical protein